MAHGTRLGNGLGNGVKSGGTEERVPCRKISGSSLEPFSGVEIHMEMDLEWKWMEMGHNL